MFAVAEPLHECRRIDVDAITQRLLAEYERHRHDMNAVRARDFIRQVTSAVRNDADRPPGKLHMRCGGPLDRGMLRRHVLGLVRRSEEHTSELQSQSNLVCRLLLE